MELSNTGWYEVFPGAGDRRAEFRHLLSSFSEMYATGVDLTDVAPSRTLYSFFFLIYLNFFEG